MFEERIAEFRQNGWVIRTEPVEILLEVGVILLLDRIVVILVRKPAVRHQVNALFHPYHLHLQGTDDTIPLLR